MLRVLLLEDETLLRLTLASTLPDETMTVVGAFEDAKSAVAAAAETPFDVLVTDLNLTTGSGPNGIAVATVVRRRFPEAGIVLLTSYADPRLVGATVAALEVAVRRAPDANDLREKLAGLLARIGDADSIRSANEHLAMIRQRRPDGEADDDTRRVDLMFAATAAQMGQFDDAEEVLAKLTGFDRRTKQFDPAFQPAPGHPVP